MTWILTALSLLAAILNARGKVSGFYIWIVANLGWVAVDLIKEIPSQATLFFVYTCISIYGIKQWKNKSK